MSEINENSVVHDFNDSVQQEKSAQIPPSLQPDPIAFMQVKQSFITHLNVNYRAFMDSLKNIPAMANFLNLSMQHFETGLILMEKAITLVPLQNVVIPPVQASQQETEEGEPEGQPEVSEDVNAENICESKEVA